MPRTFLVRTFLVLALILSGPYMLVGFLFCILEIPVALLAGLNGKVTEGLMTIPLAILGGFGISSLYSLSKHFWKTPQTNPNGTRLRFNVAGLVAGIACLVGTFLAAGHLIFFNDSWVLFGHLMLVPITLFIVVMLLLNRFFPPVANPPVHTDSAPAALRR